MVRKIKLDSFNNLLQSQVRIALRYIRLVRKSAIQISNELFQRSSHFRQIVVDELQLFLNKAFFLDSVAPSIKITYGLQYYKDQLNYEDSQNQYQEVQEMVNQVSNMIDKIQPQLIESLYKLDKIKEKFDERVDVLAPYQNETDGLSKALVEMLQSLNQSKTQISEKEGGSQKDWRQRTPTQQFYNQNNTYSGFQMEDQQLEHLNTYHYYQNQDVHNISMANDSIRSSENITESKSLQQLYNNQEVDFQWEDAQVFDQQPQNKQNIKMPGVKQLLNLSRQNSKDNQSGSHSNNDLQSNHFAHDQSSSLQILLNQATYDELQDILTEDLKIQVRYLQKALSQAIDHFKRQVQDVKQIKDENQSTIDVIKQLSNNLESTQQLDNESLHNRIATLHTLQQFPQILQFSQNQSQKVQKLSSSLSEKLQQQLDKTSMQTENLSTLMIFCNRGKNAQNYVLDLINQNMDEATILNSTKADKSDLQIIPQQQNVPNTNQFLQKISVKQQRSNEQQRKQDAKIRKIAEREYNQYVVDMHLQQNNGKIQSNNNVKNEAKPSQYDNQTKQGQKRARKAPVQRRLLQKIKKSN